MSEASIVPYLCVSPAIDAIAFYKAAFDAEEIAREQVPTGEISHCRMRVGKATFYLADSYPPEKWAPPGPEGHSVGIQFQVENSRDVYDRAIAAGATVGREFKSDDYGDWGIVIDPFGHRWTIIRLNEEFGTANVPA